MKLVIVIVIAFLILMYVYTYIKYRKGKSHSIDTISDFHNKYLKENTSLKEKSNYITKYNSTLDYVEKNKFMDS